MTSAGTLPNEVTIGMRYTTIDDVSGHTVYDEFTLKVTGT
jgi:hypothetical protein